MRKGNRGKKRPIVAQTEVREAGIKPSGIKAFVATPAYDGKVDTDFAVALAETAQQAAVVGIEVVAAVMGNGAFIELARNTFVQQFLKTDCTHLFFIDADLRWESRAFIGLLASGYPVAAGVYRRRQEPESYPVQYVEDSGGLEIVNGGWIPCSRVPTGFLCIRRDVIERMVQKCHWWSVAGQEPVPRLFYTREDTMEEGWAPGGDLRSFTGEDFAFCDDYREQFDQPIYVWPDFDFTHGGYECNWHEFINRTIDKQEKAEMAEAYFGPRLDEVA
jgi:hypothetical protein